MTRIIVASVQAGSVLFDTTATLLAVEQFIRETAGSGARVVVLREAFKRLPEETGL